jgi:hypothetical protein
MKSLVWWLRLFAPFVPIFDRPGVVPLSHVIAELGFGFWRFMLSRAREPKLGTAIRQQFPHARRGRSRNDLAQLRHLVEPLHHLRNRIAHHEPVWSANLAQRHDDAVGLIRITNPGARGKLWEATRPGPADQGCG